jgi:hypothetical protein
MRRPARGPRRPGRSARYWSSGAACAYLLLGIGAAHADSLNRTTYGTAGMIEMPSARMQRDGEMSVTADYFENTQRYALDMQFLPWLDASFRYSGLKNFDPSFPIYWDRSFGIKARLWDETDVFPAVALGINDVVGTGIYSAEYLVASKRFGPVDASLGMGWGRMATAAQVRNPLTLLSHSFEGRTLSTTPGGTGNLGELFHGHDVGLFGGINWTTPVPGLSLLAEYSSDSYQQEASAGNFHPANQTNFGLSYTYGNFQFSLDWLYGNTLGGSVSVFMDPTTRTYPEKPFPVLPPIKVRTEEEQRQALNNLSGHHAARRIAALPQDRKAARNEFADALFAENGDATDIRMQGAILSLTLPANADISQRCTKVAHVAQLYEAGYRTVALNSGGRKAQCEVGQLIPATYLSDTAPAAPDYRAAQRALTTHAKAQGLNVVAIRFSNTTALVYYTNDLYMSETEALGRLTRLLMTDAPPDIEVFRLILIKSGPVRQFDILRTPLERGISQNDEATTLYQQTVTASLAPLQNPVLSQALRGSYPQFYWGIAPQLRQALFDPSHPVGLQLTAGLNASVQFDPHFSLAGAVEASLYDDFADRGSDSVLPHVRTDFNRYFAKGKTGIAALEGDYRFRLAPNVFGVARAGYLESMFAGAGGEILWRPEGQRWALGVDVYRVKQRNFDRLFGLQPYQVTTGHVALYYQSPFYDLNFALRAGQYLAGDRGITFEVTRRFSTGVEIGAFMTRTNISAARFGEGSFDKGIMIRIPLDWALPINSQSGIGMDLHPVQRDGGQRLLGDALLYQETRGASQGDMESQSDRFVMP